MTAPRPRPSPRPRPELPAGTPSADTPRRPPRPTLRGRARTAWRDADARVAAREAEAAKDRREPPIDPTSWSGALIVMLAVTAALWIVQLADSLGHLHLQRFGLRPRHVEGLRGIVIAPFVHGDLHHMLSDTVPLVAIGWVVLLAGVRVWAVVTVVVIVLGGALTWLVGPSHSTIVGASGVVFGWLGYLIARAVFSRSIKWIIVAALVGGFFSTLLFGIFSSLNSSVAWEDHVCGLVAGVAIGALLHPRGTELRQFRRSSRPSAS